LADSEHTIMSHIMASSQPPPRQKPETAAINGVCNLEICCHSRNMSTDAHSSYVLSFISEMSAPAAKALLEPVRTMQRT
jgi:hypothetical protein